MRTVFEYFWSDWRIGLVFAVGLAAGTGLISAWLTPRGPVTTPQALTSMSVALLIGVAAGLVMGSRWSTLITSTVFVVVFEFRIVRHLYFQTLKELGALFCKVRGRELLIIIEFFLYLLEIHGIAPSGLSPNVVTLDSYHF